MGAPLVRRELRGRPGRMAFLFTAVTAAVAFCTAGFGFSDQLSVQLSGDDEALLSFPVGTITVSADSGGTTQATAIDDTLVERVQAVDGVLGAFGVLDQPVAFNVRARQQPDRPVQLRGLVLSSAWDENRWELVEGREPVESDEVAVDAGGAIVGLAPLGSRRRLQLPTGTRRVEVVGLVRAVGSQSGSRSATQSTFTPEQVAINSAHVVLPAEHAPELLGAVGKVDRINVVPAQGVDSSELAELLREELPGGLDVVVITDRAQSTQDTVASIDEGVRSGTTAFALLTVVVATFAVANVQTVVLAQRTRELALLRLVGASRAQLARIVIVEAVLVGIAATVIGLGAGSALAWLAADMVDPLGVDASLMLTGGMVAAAVVVGLFVTLVGSLWPAVRASRAAPMDALSDSGAGAEAGLVGPLVPAVSLMARVVAPVSGVAGRLGVGNVGRRPARSAAAGATLMLTLVLVGSVATLGAGARQTVTDRFESNGSADLYLERRGLVRVDTTSLVEQLQREAGGISGGAEVVAVDGVLVGPAGTERRVTTSGLVRLDSMMNLEVTAGDPAGGSDASDPFGDGPTDGAMLADATAAALGVEVGDEVTLQSSSGRETQLDVVATYSNTAFVGPAVVAPAAVAEVDAEGTFELAALRVAEGVPEWAARRSVSRVTDEFPRVRVHTPESFAELDSEVTDTVLRVIWVLLVGSVGIGFLGLASTQALAVLERRHELVMLRAVGASRGQIRGLIALEAAVIVAVAAAIGLGAGVAAGWWGAGLVPSELVARPLVPWTQLATVGVASVAVAALVSLAVARRATQVAPAEAGRP